MTEPDLIIGIDPGLAACGFCALHSETQDLFAEVLRTRPKDGDDAARLEKIADGLSPLFWIAMAGVPHGACIILAVETQYGRQHPNPQVAAAMAAATARGPAAVRGLVEHFAQRQGWSVVEVSPAAAKRAMTGNPNASKQQVQRMVEARFGEKLPQDAADAAAIAVAAKAELKARELATAGGDA